MVQATTPTFEITLAEDIGAENIVKMVFTLAQGVTTVSKTVPLTDIVGRVVSVFLDQSETLPFKRGNATLQLNWLYANGSRGCTEEATIAVEDNLLDEVMTA